MKTKKATGMFAGFRMPSELKKKLLAIACREERSLSYIIRKAIEAYVKG